MLFRSNKVNVVKGNVLAFSDNLSDTTTKAYADVKLALPKAITEGNAAITKSANLVAALKKLGIDFKAPVAVK